MFVKFLISQCQTWLIENMNRKPPWKVKKLKPKFTLILDKLYNCALNNPAIANW